ncbi:hypothetical protein PS2_027996 [Malus domestica]
MILIPPLNAPPIRRVKKANGSDYSGAAALADSKLHYYSERGRGQNPNSKERKEGRKNGDNAQQWVQNASSGSGVWLMEGKEIRDLLINALNLGYRHFDCAADYKNEPEVGEALTEAFSTGLVKREDLFITTKLWNSDHGHVVEACKDSLKKLRLDYLDLYQFFVLILGF